tara:strand:+ start:41 stop:208 length:168 start_codon:yes stop_codon:yes gene_type:complete
MTREECIEFLTDCADDLCICGVASNQMEFKNLSDAELASLVGIIKKMRTDKEEKL